eukprot:tig00021135_g18943.t1
MDANLLVPRARLLRSGSTPRDYGTASDAVIGREAGVEAVLGVDDPKKRSTREIYRRNELRKAHWLPEKDSRRGRTTSFCTAREYRMEELFDYMRRKGRQPQFFQEVIHVPFGDDELCDLFFFPYGAVVMWGLRRSEELKVLAELRESGCEEQPLGPDTKDDDFRFVYQESFPRMLEETWSRALATDPKAALRMVSIVRDEFRLPSMRLKSTSDGASSTDPERGRTAGPAGPDRGAETAGDTAGEETAGEATEDEGWRARLQRAGVGEAARGAETEPEATFDHSGAGAAVAAATAAGRRSAPASPTRAAAAAAAAGADGPKAGPSSGAGPPVPVHSSSDGIDRARRGRLGYRIQDILYKLAYSHAIGLSIKLDDFEGRTQRTIERTRKLPEEMARDGRISLSSSGIAKHVGHLFLLRSSVNLHSEMLDVPEFFWEFSELEPLYLATASYLNLKTRVRVLNQRLDALKEFDEVLVDQMNDKNASFLMRVIIFLIAVNILIYVAAEWGGHLRRAMQM